MIDSGLYESEEEAARRKEVLGRIDEVIDWFRCFSHYLFKEKKCVRDVYIGYGYGRPFYALVDALIVKKFSFCWLCEFQTVVLYELREIADRNDGRNTRKKLFLFYLWWIYML